MMTSSLDWQLATYLVAAARYYDVSMEELGEAGHRTRATIVRQAAASCAILAGHEAARTRKHMRTHMNYGRAEQWIAANKDAAWAIVKDATTIKPEVAVASIRGW